MFSGGRNDFAKFLAAPGRSPADITTPVAVGSEASGGDGRDDVVLGGATAGPMSSAATSIATSGASTTSSPSSSSGNSGANGGAAAGSSSGATGSSTAASSPTANSSAQPAGTSGPDDVEAEDDPPPAQGSNLWPALEEAKAFGASIWGNTGGVPIFRGHHT